ncbi:hypothetical protein SLG_22240 [Sphingobium sp. SYK-6]|uniref:hypothetical protein n=1 Tax=Sphingobium sp. (strain NBRC 103272 / SYK-6) TaxID=627192 RepID=UPI000227713F|nr:hypothetical protein [Sphingobium sp. SYK-6]BAK66899.1 hypothetical protein SLG_22240 [Sphingobium sp. SYK-6]
MNDLHDLVTSEPYGAMIAALEALQPTYLADPTMAPHINGSLTCLRNLRAATPAPETEGDPDEPEPAPV